MLLLGQKTCPNGSILGELEAADEYEVFKLVFCERTELETPTLAIDNADIRVEIIRFPFAQVQALESSVEI
ncbi:unnamed protein product [Dibothriocephalus latus]|uniref:Uncharacterized protein n=1 Tax=Dibothriocephalus latus TaxID=60516 RepID=A0A3P6RBC9_DIBLA|nr:unnamed protein product [Dibothriocephalus latus]